MKYILVCLFLMGCTSPNPDYNATTPQTGVDMALANTPDMLGAPSPDMVQVGDMTPASAPDMTQLPDMTALPSPDMVAGADMTPLPGPDMLSPPADLASAPRDMVQPADMTPLPDMTPLCPGQDVVCNGFCTNTQTNTNNCGACGHVCANGGTCAAGVCLYTHHDTFCSDTWTDDSPTVDPSNPATAALACAACCKTMTGAACGCDQYSGFDQSGNAYAEYLFAFHTTTAVQFFYHDDTGRWGTGKANQQQPSGETTPVWWDQ